MPDDTFLNDFDEKKSLSLNSLGIVPGPSESTQDFERRAAFCLILKEHLSKDLKTDMKEIQKTLKAIPNTPSSVREDGLSDNTPESIGSSPPPSEVLIAASREMASFYDISPLWIPLFFSNYQLPFWQGGCAWIFQITEDSPTAALIQLRHTFSHSERYFGIYDRKELLEHELTHVGRMCFQEPAFEEILAYKTSKSPFRRWLGPVFQSSTESFLFLMVIALIFVFDSYLFSLHRLDAHQIALWLTALPIGYFTFLMGRLVKRHHRFNRCLKNLCECLHSLPKARYVIYRLQDCEINIFAKMSCEKIREYALSQSTKELRWKMIVTAYF